MKFSQFLKLFGYLFFLCLFALGISSCEKKSSENETQHQEKIVIAIVDDGIRITHQELRDFIWANEKETSKNNIDDDGNGFIDDINGWDVSDDNNRVTPPEERLEEYYHGTHLAGIVSQNLKSIYGQKASELFSIMPIKALTDEASQTYIKDGYQGIEYAIKMDADIIIAAWGVGYITPEQRAILKKASEAGIIVVAAAGNFPQGDAQYPAAAESVIGVAGVDSEGIKTESSNYGLYVDISALGHEVKASNALADDSYQSKTGTSQATAMVAAAVAMIKEVHPDYSYAKIKACLKHGADDIASKNPKLIASLGAGHLNVEAVRACRLFEDEMPNNIGHKKPQGYLYHLGRSEQTRNWSIKPMGEFAGLRFRLQSKIQTESDGVLEFYKVAGDRKELVTSYPLNSLAGEVYVAGTAAEVILKTQKSRKPIELLIDYQAEPIDFSTLYCKGKKELTKPGRLTDGSGDKKYSPKTSCQWLITAQEGKKIRFEFPLFNTQKKIDQVMFFDGDNTRSETLIANFSGSGKPPVLTSWGNQVLVWFVTDGDVEEQGWETNYTFVDP